MSTRLHQGGNFLVASETKAAKSTPIVLIVDLHFASHLETPNEHVCARSLHAEEKHRSRVARVHAVPAPPSPLPPSDDKPLHRVELVLLD
jgi:hypothetical protein